MLPDMKFGWKPKDPICGAPIPLYYDYEPLDIPINHITNEEYEPIYLGARPKHSLDVHKLYANKDLNDNDYASYPFKFPSNMSMIE